MLEEALRNDDVIATVIVDKYHIHPQLVRDWIARKEVSRFIGITDVGFVLGAPKGAFEVFGIRGVVSEDGEYMRVLPPGDNGEKVPTVPILFGSVVTMRFVLFYFI